MLEKNVIAKNIWRKIDHSKILHPKSKDNWI